VSSTASLSHITALIKAFRHIQQHNTALWQKDSSILEEMPSAQRSEGKDSDRLRLAERGFLEVFSPGQGMAAGNIQNKGCACFVVLKVLSLLSLGTSPPK